MSGAFLPDVLEWLCDKCLLCVVSAETSYKFLHDYASNTRMGLLHLFDIILTQQKRKVDTNGACLGPRNRQEEEKQVRGNFQDQREKDKATV